MNYGPEGDVASCSDGFDNEGDGVADCADVDCSGVGACPICGDVDVPESEPLILPDGVSSSAACMSDAMCSAGAPNCIVSPYLDGGGECHGSYTSTLDWSGFPTNAILTNPDQLQKICVNMEHSYLRDLQIDLIPPDGRQFVLQKFRTQSGGEIFLGEAHDPDDSSPAPGMGFDYCWTPTAMYQMIDSTTEEGVVAPTTQPSINGHSTVMKPGDYKSASPWTDLMGSPLNGEWKIRVTDLWGSDNGYIFSWSITFDPSLIIDCTAPPVIQ